MKQQRGEQPTDRFNKNVCAYMRGERGTNFPQGKVVCLHECNQKELKRSCETHRHTQYALARIPIVFRSLNCEIINQCAHATTTVLLSKMLYNKHVNSCRCKEQPLYFQDF